MCDIRIVDFDIMCDMSSPDNPIPFWAQFQTRTNSSPDKDKPDYYIVQRTQDAYRNLWKSMQFSLFISGVKHNSPSFNMSIRVASDLTRLVDVSQTAWEVNVTVTKTSAHVLMHGSDRFGNSVNKEFKFSTKNFKSEFEPHQVNGITKITGTQDMRDLQKIAKILPNNTPVN